MQHCEKNDLELLYVENNVTETNEQNKEPVSQNRYRNEKSDRELRKIRVKWDSLVYI